MAIENNDNKKKTTIWLRPSMLARMEVGYKQTTATAAVSLLKRLSASTWDTWLRKIRQSSCLMRWSE